MSPPFYSFGCVARPTWLIILAVDKANDTFALLDTFPLVLITPEQVAQTEGIYSFNNDLGTDKRLPVFTSPLALQYTNDLKKIQIFLSDYMKAFQDGIEYQQQKA